MSSVLESVDLLEIEDQTAFNMAAWGRILADPELAKYSFRVESNRYGHAVMSPPPSYEHGKSQSRVGLLLGRLLPDGFIVNECPVSTREGVRAIDTAWISRERDAAQRGLSCLTLSPEICVEVISPSNSRREMNEKRALYFEAGAEEVWFCERDGTMRFYRKGEPETALSASLLCPAFPLRLEL